MGVAKQHTSTSKKLIKQLKKNGFAITCRGNGYCIEKEGKSYFSHLTEASIHPLRRDFRKLYGIEL